MNSTMSSLADWILNHFRFIVILFRLLLLSYLFLSVDHHFHLQSKSWAVQKKRWLFNFHILFIPSSSWWITSEFIHFFFQFHYLSEFTICLLVNLVAKQNVASKLTKFIFIDEKKNVDDWTTKGQNIIQNRKEKPKKNWNEK